MKTARAFALLTTVLGLCGAAQAAPTLRFKADQKGDFVLFGNTVGFDCAAGTPAPVVGSVGMCGSNTSESSPDIFWRSDEPATGQATASLGITGAQARSTAMLVLPAGAQVTYARLYWSAARTGTQNDTSVSVVRPGMGMAATITADVTTNATSMTIPHTYYQSSADVTALVKGMGAGAYRVSGIETLTLSSVADNRVYIGWWMVVLYQLDGEPPRNLAIFDGLDMVEPTTPTITVPISGFQVPNAGFDAKLGVIAYEGDGDATGDQLSFNDPMFANPLANALNPATNFFNSTRTFEAPGVTARAVSNAGDLPRLTGTSRSMSGMDLDVVNVTGRVAQGDTSATVSVRTTGEFIILGGLVTSIATFRPDFTTTAKTFRNLTVRPDGAVRPGDILEYTVSTTNSGNDVGTAVTLRDQLPAGVTYVPGSIRVTVGPNTGAKTDAAGDDQAEFTAATRTITVRLGTGANATAGGTLAVGGTTTVTFQARINADATGTILNQAIVSAAGMMGAPAATYSSDGNGPDAGTPPTGTIVDACIVDMDCAGQAGKPFCRNTAGQHPFVCVECKLATDCKQPAAPVCNPTTNVCTGCTADADCAASAATPACQASGSCGQCSATNKTLCLGDRPVCVVAQGVCGCNANADCPAATPVCDPTMKRCVARTGCLTNADCGGITPVCAPATGVCGPCVADGPPSCIDPRFPACQKTGPLAGSCTECSDTNSARCGGPKPQCFPALGFCGCSSTDGDSECGGPTSGVVCNATVGICTPGCALPPLRNKCPDAQMCNATGEAIGACVNPSCTVDADCRAPRPRCDVAAMPRSCVQCLTTADCGAPFLCDAAGTKTCVECTQADRSNCSPNGAGARCLANASCGCQTDDECGPATSGRVCDGGISKCSPGCRGTGGNRCPAGLICTSTTMDIGRCVPPGTPLDGGSDAPRDGSVDSAGGGSDAPSDAAADTSDARAGTADGSGGDVADARRDDASADGVIADGGADAAPDADGIAPPGYLAGGGCRCSLGAADDSRSALPLALLPVAFALVLRRRRR